MSVSFGGVGKGVGWLIGVKLSPRLLIILVYCLLCQDFFFFISDMWLCLVQTVIVFPMTLGCSVMSVSLGECRESIF